MGSASHPGSLRSMDETLPRRTTFSPDTRDRLRRTKFGEVQAPPSLEPNFPSPKPEQNNACCYAQTSAESSECQGFIAFCTLADRGDRCLVLQTDTGLFQSWSLSSGDGCEPSIIPAWTNGINLSSVLQSIFATVGQCLK